MARDIRQTIFFPQAPQTVWEYLTKAELLSQWLMENDIQPVVGHKFNFKAKPALEIDFDGVVYCEIKKVAPHQQLSYSWNCNPVDTGFKINTVVNWTLVPKDNGTELILHQTGFDDHQFESFYMAMTHGWAKRTEALLQRINSKTA